MPRSQEELNRLLAPDVDKTELVRTLAYVTFAGDPTDDVVPDFIGQECLDTSGSHWYRAHGLTVADWKKLNN